MSKPDPDAKPDDLIRLSRERCRGTYRLEEKTVHPVMRLRDAELAPRREAFLDGIGGFAPELDRGALLPDKTRHCMLIADAKGFVVEAYTPVAHERDFQSSGIGLGGFWDERSAGTNGIAMAMRTGRVISVVGPDHFHACFHGFACTSAPLLDAQANIIGSVTLVGSTRRRAEELAWCERVLSMAAVRFQTRLFRNFHAGRMTARLFSKSADGTGHFESIAACDDRGTIVASLPLSLGSQTPVEHRNLQGRHLSDLPDLTINVRGPAQELPSRRVRTAPAPGRSLPTRKFPGEALARLAAQGGGMDLVVERARKLLSHRVPLLLCGEPASGKAELIKLLLDDMNLTSSIAIHLDGAALPSDTDLDDALSQTRFLSEYPIKHLPPLLVLLNVNRLAPELLRKLEAFLRQIEPSSDGVGDLPERPVLVFTADCSWADLSGDATPGEDLLFRIGQAILDLPPVRHRSLAAVLDTLLQTEHGPGVEIAPNAKAALMSYHWPGNLQEMRAILREALICGNGRRINLPDLPQRILTKAAPATPANKAQSLQEALDSTGWNVTRAARLLGKSRATVNRWILEQGLRRPE